MAGSISQFQLGNQGILVYIPDLPTNCEENYLQNTIQNRVKSILRTQVIFSIKCYMKLSLAIVQLMSFQDKEHLVSNIQSIVLDPKSGINISFVDQIDLFSYIVFNENNDNIPSINDIKQYCSHTYQISKDFICESISHQFPNIFRIHVQTIDDLVKIANKPNLLIDDISATFYPRADCNYFEDLPQNTDNKKLKSVIATQIGEEQLAPSSFYVQYNKNTTNAIVITSKSIKKWSNEDRITIDGQYFSKKSRLSYRVLVSPVSNDLIELILKHDLFIDHVVSNKHNGDQLLVELDDMNSYKRCLRNGAVRINKIMMIIEDYTVVCNLDDGEIDKDWYETKMRHIPSDIRLTIPNSSHSIFHFKWNAQAWKEQMEETEKLDKNSDTYNRRKHKLRVIAMLHTYGIIKRANYFVDGENVRLISEPMTTIGYDHQAKLKHGEKISETELKTPYSSTTVKVINEDCLVTYEKLVSEGRRPLLLNMANQSIAGGGYCTGDGAQEENLFRRSNYCHCLDAQLADRHRSERRYCTSKCEIKPVTGYGDYYPMETFGAIYSSGVSFFRGTEADGYPLMKKPLHNVCCLAMAAYRHPQLKNSKRLQNRMAMNMRKKIENIFSIGYQQKHDCLVLSALGCGAFRNPPEHIALLFKSVIYQFAGYFETIYFSIIDDHNAKTGHNPDGNFLPFKTLLHDLVVYPPKSLRMNSVSGPHRILNKTLDGQLILSDVCISDFQPCQHGNDCRDIKKADHIREYSHPPKCPFQSAISSCEQMDDDVHISTFSHTTKCELGGECTNQDLEHLNDYDHPGFCKDAHRCNIIVSGHLREFRHLPICPDGTGCLKYLESKEDHVKMYRHCRSICPEDNCCNKFSDPTHMKIASHSFRKACPLTPYNCLLYVEFFQCQDQTRLSPNILKHCLEYSHMCPYGRQCRTNNAHHYQTTFHIARYLCSDGEQCTKLNDNDHFESYSHPRCRDIRLLCRDSGFECKLRLDTNHQQRYRHKQNFDHFSVVPVSNLNSGINFAENQRELIKIVRNYINSQNWSTPNIIQDVRKWVRVLQPVHRCGPKVFQSILVHGHIMSLHQMDLLERPSVVANAVLQHKKVRSILLKHNMLTKSEKPFKLIHALVKSEFAKTGTDGIILASLDPDHEKNINIAKMGLQASLNNNELKTIEEWTTEIAQASVQLHGNRSGLQYPVDKSMGTDQHVFSILGPHSGFHYGDIVIIFKQEIMYHPYANFSSKAATYFHSGTVYTEFPYFPRPDTTEGRIADFHNLKLHCSIPRYEDAAAIELIAATILNKKTTNITLNDVIERWITAESHRVFESHLPQLIPLDYIERVYIPQNLFESLPDESQRLTRDIFGKSLILTVHQIDITSIDPDKLKKLDDTRKPYLNFILTEIMQMIAQKMSNPSSHLGTIITIPGSKFEEHIVLPLSITGSYNLYLLDHDNAPHKPVYTYIYWQMMYGDMMLTIANKKLDPNKTQSNLQCLICYVAGIPLETTTDYHENYSYLNTGNPFQQDIYISQGNVKAKSNVFYRSCNTDNFFTFCIKLSHRTGEVTLSHAGPNAVYNREEIYYRFAKHELDLSKLDYIHLSAGNLDVPVRNLTINHQQISQLHPSSDKSFKIDTSKFLDEIQVIDEPEPYLIHPIPMPIKNKPNIPKRLVQPLRVPSPPPPSPDKKPRSRWVTFNHLFNRKKRSTRSKSREPSVEIGKSPSKPNQRRKRRAQKARSHSYEIKRDGDTVAL